MNSMPLEGSFVNSRHQAQRDAITSASANLTLSKDHTRLKKRHIKGLLRQTFISLLVVVYTIGNAQTIDGHAFAKTTILHSEAPIRLILPHDSANAHVYTNPVLVLWEVRDNKGPFRITVKSLLKETLYETETTVSKIELDLTQYIFLKEKVFYVIVSSTTDPTLVSAEHIIKRCTLTQQNLITNSLETINAGHTAALDQLILAGFYEDHRLYTDAVKAYTKAVAVARDTLDYQQFFDLFLIRHAFKPE